MASSCQLSTIGMQSHSHSIGTVSLCHTFLCFASGMGGVATGSAYFQVTLETAWVLSVISIPLLAYHHFHYPPGHQIAVWVGNLAHMTCWAVHDLLEGVSQDQAGRHLHHCLARGASNCK